MTNEYLSFAKRLNDSTFSLQFSEEIENVWGESWNVCPASIIGGLNLDESFLSSFIFIKCDKSLKTAEENNCFSMQDCIDGIIPLIYTSLEENTLMNNDVPFFIKFGETKENVYKLLEDYSIAIIKEEKINDDKSEEIMTKLLDDLDGFTGSDNNSIDNFDF